MNSTARLKWLRRYLSKKTEIQVRDITTEMIIALNNSSKDRDIESKYLLIRISEALRLIQGYGYRSAYMLDDELHIYLWNKYIAHAISLQRLCKELSQVSIEGLKDLCSTEKQI